MSILGLTSLGKKARVVFRSSVTGRFVSKEYAVDHPDTTQREKVD